MMYGMGYVIWGVGCEICGAGIDFDGRRGEVYGLKC